MAQYRKNFPLKTIYQQEKNDWKTSLKYFLKKFDTYKKN